MLTAQHLLGGIKGAYTCRLWVWGIVCLPIEVSQTLEGRGKGFGVFSENLFTDFEKPLRQRDGLVVFVLGGELGNASLQFFNLARLWRGGAPTRGERQHRDDQAEMPSDVAHRAGLGKLRMNGPARLTAVSRPCFRSAARRPELVKRCRFDCISINGDRT